MESLIVDSFAGGGGASTGIEMALGRSPDIAINHNADALALHAANHPETLHLSENIFKVDPLDHVKGRHVGLAWFSPDCKHFSKAKGGKPVERNIRDLAWVIVLWAERAKPDVIIMENVEEWKEWGPLIETDRGLMPCPDSRGQTFQKWCKAMRRAGYKLEHRELRACDYGAPTIRKRLFVVARRDGQPITWPKPTHGAPTDADVIAGRKKPWRTAAEIIDWSQACPSIFDTSSEIMGKFGLRAVRPLAYNTMARVARGMKRYVLDAANPFIVSIDKTTIPSVIRFNTGATGQDAREPLSTITANSFIKRPGGAAPIGIIAPHLSAFYGPGAGGQDRSASPEEPVRVVPTENRHAVVAPNLMSMKGTDRRDRAVDAPHPSVLAGGGHSAVVVPHMMTMRNSGKPFNGADEPTHTITAGGAGLSVVAPILSYAQQGGGNRSFEEPYHTVTASSKDQNTTAFAFVAQHNNDSRRIGGVNPGRPATEPLSTATATGAQQGVVSAFVSRQFGASVGHGMDDPAATATGGANKSALVAPFLQAYYGTGDGGEENQPARTITTKDRHGHVEASISAPPFTADQEDRAREVAAFMRSYGFWDEREFVTLTIAGDVFVIVDIGMRMLTPRELYSAQGFPPDYKIDADAAGKPFTKSVQVSCVGNSVSPPVACALVAANCQNLMAYAEAAE